MSTGREDHDDDKAALSAEAAPDDDRLDYEPPRIVKKRGVARATLFTVMGPAMTGITTMG